MYAKPYPKRDHFELVLQVSKRLCEAISAISAYTMVSASAKWLLYHCGILAAYHRLRNKSTLTVLMFHRILPETMQDGVGSDPLWTISTALFDDILKFLKRHYNFVRLDDVAAALDQERPLPARALLISFDDGWRDSLSYALPILNRHGTSAVLFATSDAIEDGRVCWWQDVVSWALRTGRKDAATLLRDLSTTVGEPAAEPEVREDEFSVLARLAALDPAERDAVLDPLTRHLETLQDGRQMLDAASLGELVAAGIEIGSHGAAHLPLTQVADPARDLDKAKRRITALTGNAKLSSLSFPHGKYDDRVVDCARTLGYDLQFSSDAIINECPFGQVRTGLIGRIPIFSALVSRPNGRLSAPRLAAFLFLRHRGQLVIPVTNCAGG